MSSMLGILVFPWGHLVFDHAKGIPFNTLQSNGWPAVTLGGCETLYDLLWHLRNAVAHGHLTYSSNSRT
jgi:hypothetical protein